MKSYFSVKAPTASASHVDTEGEYIRNLRNQIYYLELECKYLRDEVQKVCAHYIDFNSKHTCLSWLIK